MKTKCSICICVQRDILEGNLVKLWSKPFRKEIQLGGLLIVLQLIPIVLQQEYRFCKRAKKTVGLIRTLPVTDLPVAYLDKNNFTGVLLHPFFKILYKA